MLTYLLEKLILQVLKAFVDVDSITRDKLRCGVFQGYVDLSDLRLKPEATSLLSCEETLKVKSGAIGRIKLSLPLNRIYSGKVSLKIESVHIELAPPFSESPAYTPGEADLNRSVEDIRERKNKAIAALVELFREQRKFRKKHAELDLLRKGHDRAGEPQMQSQEGWGAKFCRKIVNNINVDLHDLQVSYLDDSKGFACHIGLEDLQVLSTDWTFRHGPDQDEAGAPSDSLYKLLRLQNLSFRMAPANSSELMDASYVLQPVSAGLRLAHTRQNGSLEMHIEVAKQERLELTLVRSQIKHLMSMRAGKDGYMESLKKRLIPPEYEELLDQDLSTSMGQYHELYRRHLANQPRWRGRLAGVGAGCDYEPLSEREEVQKGVLEHALSSRVLAKSRLLAEDFFDELQTPFQRTRAPFQRPETGWTRGRLPIWIARLVHGMCGHRSARSRLARCATSCCSPMAQQASRAAILGRGMTSRSLSSVDLFRRSYSPLLLLGQSNYTDWCISDLLDTASLEDVDIPTRYQFNFQLGKFVVNLVDDRWESESQQQLLHLDMEEAALSIHVKGTTDYHGRDSAEWSIGVKLGDFHAQKEGHSVFKFIPNQVTTGEALPGAGVRWLAHRSGLRDEDEPGDEYTAAKLVVASRLGSSENVMALHFNFEPTEIRLQSGLVQDIRDYISYVLQSEDSSGEAAISTPSVSPANRDEYTFSRPRSLSRSSSLSRSNSLSRGNPSRSNLHELGERFHESFPKTLGSLENAKKVAERVYERIPDKLELRVTIKSPEIDVPLPGQGTTRLNFRVLHVRTPEPCKYTHIDIKCTLDDMAIVATTTQGTHFHIFQPVATYARVKYTSTELDRVTVEVNVDRAVVTLAPPAIQMLLATPFAIMGIMWPHEHEEEADVPEGLDVNDVEGPPGGDQPASGAADVPELGEEPQATGSEEAQEAKEAGPRRNFVVEAQVNFAALDLTLAESVVPVMVLRMQWSPPGLTVYKESLPHPYLGLNISFTLEADILNPRNNQWESLIEHFHGGFEMVRKQPNERSMTQMVINCGDKLLFNMKPSTLQRALQYMPLFFEGFTSDRELVMTSPDGRTSDVSKYRVMNLCDEKFELEFKSCKQTGLVTQVEPTGSKEMCLDEWVMAHFPTALVVRRVGSKQSSQPLSLDHCGVVAIPETGMLAQLLTPGAKDHMQHRMLLLASPLRMYNCTDKTLIVRFHAAPGRAPERHGGPGPALAAGEISPDILKVPIAESMSCDGSKLGYFPPDSTPECVAAQAGGEDEGGARPGCPQQGFCLMLPPNAFGSIPSPALVRDLGDDLGDSRVRFSVNTTTGLASFSAAKECGAHKDACILKCRTRSSTDSIHFLCEAHMETETSPSPISFTTIVLRPPLVLLNALPNCSLIVSHGPRNMGAWQDWLWQETRVPSRGRVPLYNSDGMLHGMSFRARFEDATAPWSAVLHTEEGQHKEPGAAQTLRLRQVKEGAPAGVIVEHLDGFELRFSCPIWFVDRSSLSSKLGSRLERLERNGRPLPRYGDITLMPSKCLEKDCEFVVFGESVQPDGAWDCPFMCRGSGSTQPGTATCVVRPPVSWSLAFLRSSSMSHVLCVQVDDVDPRDMLGAQCQTMTLKPRLMLTNASDVDIEFRPADKAAGENLTLAAGASQELYWPVQPNEDEAPDTKLNFRPLSPKGCCWSEAVVCNDIAAGSVPYLLPTRASSRAGRPNGGTDPRQHAGVPQVWSVEIAPARGLLAVKFWRGSDFVVINRIAHLLPKPKVAIRPCNDNPDRQVPDIRVPHNESPVPYGWLQPSPKRSIHIVINGNPYHPPIDDVRWTKVYKIRSLNLILEISRNGTTTALTLLDRWSNDKRKAAKGTVFSVEVKINRLGVSLIEEMPHPQELFYLQLDIIRFEYERKQEDDKETAKLVICDAQVDCQLPGRFDALTTDIHVGLMQQQRPTVILANRTVGDKVFLDLLIERVATSSRDLFLSRASVAIDELDITVDDGWLEPLLRFVDQCQSSTEQERGVSFEDVEKLAGRPAAEDYKPPPLPSVVQVDSLQIATVKLTLWCGFKLKHVTSLNPYLQQALKVLSFSDELALDDATLMLKETEERRLHGSLNDILRELANKYIFNLVRSAGVVLQKSSLLNLPRLPMKIGGSAISLFTDGMGLFVGEAASLMEKLTLDDEYIQRRQKLRSEKQINNIKDGMAEAITAITHGVEGVFDVVKKPREGWRTGGFCGAVVGCGRGVASSVVKPVTNVGEAIADVGAGISATVSPTSQNMRRRRERPRLRQPRLLFAEGAAVRPYSELEAAILQQLERSLTQDIQEVVPLDVCYHDTHVVLLLYTNKLVLAKVTVPTSKEGMDSNDRGSMGSKTRRDSVSRMLQHAFRPLNGGLFSLTQEDEDKAAPEWLEKPHQLDFRKLDDVRPYFDGVGHVLELIADEPLELPLYYYKPMMSEAVRQGLESGFRSAVEHAEGAANWAALRTALREEKWMVKESLTSWDTMVSSERTIEVYEVQRWKLGSKSPWTTPYLLTDRDLRWRWVDMNGDRHPHLNARLGRDEVSKKERPPCELDAPFKLKHDWTVDKNGTDQEGWRYGVAWKSSTWVETPGIFDVLRRRKWVKIYE